MDDEEMKFSCQKGQGYVVSDDFQYKGESVESV